MSVYNGEKHIKETIQSVLSQTFRDFELIIINDGSTDRTHEILNSYDDPRIKVFSFPKNKGIPVALNFGIERSKGDYIVKVDGDDIQHTERFEKQLEFMVDNPGLSMSKTSLSYFPDDTSVEKSDRFKASKQYMEFYKNSASNPNVISERLRWYCCVVHSTMMIKTEVLKKYQYRHFPIFEDYDLFYRLNEDGLLIGHLNETLVRVRVSSDSTTMRTQKDKFDEFAYLIKERNLERFKQNESIYIWGAGQFGESVLKVLLNRGWRIQGFFDSNAEKHGKLINGYMISKPIINFEKKHKVIIASQPGMFQIIKYLKEFNYISEEDFMVFR